LIVEDNQDDYEATVRSLKKKRFGHTIQWSRNGLDAVDYLNNGGQYAVGASGQRPDLILLDLNLPGISGREVLEYIKNDMGFTTIPVVILTTSTDGKDINHCYKFGANSYIQKPVNFEGLTEAVGSLISYWFSTVVLPECI
jgi:CheY-like chemotaxis protein